MRQYKVLRSLINAPVGTILTMDSFSKLNTDDGLLVPINIVQEAITQGFIEPYAPEPKHWRAKNGRGFWFINERGNVFYRVDYYTGKDNGCYNSNNYYKSQATAELVAKAQKLMLEWLRAGQTIELESYWLYATDEAQKAVIADDDEGCNE